MLNHPGKSRMRPWQSIAHSALEGFPQNPDLLPHGLHSSFSGTIASGVTHRAILQERGLFSSLLHLLLDTPNSRLVVALQDDLLVT